SGTVCAGRPRCTNVLATASSDTFSSIAAARAAARRNLPSSAAAAASRGRAPITPDSWTTHIGGYSHPGQWLIRWNRATSGPTTNWFATSTPHTITTASPAAATCTSAHLRWYTLPSGARNPHRVSHLPGFRAPPALPAPAGRAVSLLILDMRHRARTAQGL